MSFIFTLNRFVGARSEVPNSGSAIDRAGDGYGALFIELDAVDPARVAPKAAQNRRVGHVPQKYRFVPRTRNKLF